MSETRDPGPVHIAKEAERIYKEKYQEEYEDKYDGKFVAIDIESEIAYLGDHPENALQKAREGSSFGVFHLIRVGASGAFNMGYVAENETDWNWPIR